MALSISTNFAGNYDPSKFISPLLFSNSLVTNNLVTVWPNIKYKQNIQLADFDGALVADACDFSASGTISLSEAVLQPEKIKLQTSFCKTDLESHWISAQMRAGANNSDVPTEVGDWLTSYIANKMSGNMERLMLEGKKAGTSGIYVSAPYLKLADGLFYNAYSNASSGRKVASTTLTTSNIQTELDKVYTAIPAQLIADPNLVILMSHTDYRVYLQSLALTFTANSNFDITKPAQNTFRGIRIFPVQLEASHMLAGIPSDWHIGTDLVSDYNEVIVLDMKDKDASNNVRISARMSVDTVVTNDNTVVYGTPIA